ncbi:excise [Gordonia phage Meyran]|nr:excise [Gordonia phage Meyran]
MRKAVAQSATPADSPVNEAIRVGLARRRATQGALATHLQLSQPAIHRRMTGKVAWRISELVDVAAFLGLQVSELVADEMASR